MILSPFYFFMNIFSYYYESDNQDSGGGYSMKNKAPMVEVSKIIF
jgi:hypothetical protein